MDSPNNPSTEVPQKEQKDKAPLYSRIGPDAPDVAAFSAPIDQEQTLVHDVYNEIAPHFSQTRYKPWPIVEQFLKGQEKFSVGLDVGCGNGKYLGVNKELFMIGTDRSEGLINCAYDLDNEYNLGIADGLSLPHPADTFDFAISIAVIHHFATPERRVEAIKHIVSKLRVGGKALIYCWALEQETSRRGYKEGDDQDILVPWVLKERKQKKEKKPKQKRRNGNEQETVVDTPEEPKEQPKEETKPEPVKYRYYHLYRKGELAQDSKDAGNCKLIEEGYERDNWWIIVERV